MQSLALQLISRSILCLLYCHLWANTLNTRSSATAEKQHVSCQHGGGEVGLGPPAHFPSAHLATPIRMVESESHNVRTSSVPSVKRTLIWIGHSRSFKVIPNWCRQESRMVCCRNVQLMPTLFLKLTKIRQRKNGSRRFQRPHAGLKTSQQETPSSIYKRFILPKTRVTDLHFGRW